MDKNKKSTINLINKKDKDDLKNIKKNNATIALNFLYAKKEKIYPAYASKSNSNRKKQAILLMIPNGKGWHYLTVKNYRHY